MRASYSLVFRVKKLRPKVSDLGFITLRVQVVPIYGFLVPKQALKSHSRAYLDPLG